MLDFFFIVEFLFYFLNQKKTSRKNFLCQDYKTLNMKSKLSCKIKLKDHAYEKNTQN
jgi:hypothetical protein